MNNGGWKADAGDLLVLRDPLGRVRYRLARLVEQHQGHIATPAVPLLPDSFQTQAPRREIERLIRGPREAGVNQLTVEAHDARHQGHRILAPLDLQAVDA